MNASERPASPDLEWEIQTSRDGEAWRVMGNAWTFAGEPLLVHGASKYLRFRSVRSPNWVGPLERSGGGCMALLDLDAGTRADIYPGDEHLGVPVFLPGGEAGRLLSFQLSADGYSWTYRLEFEGEVPARFRSNG